MTISQILRLAVTALAALAVSSTISFGQSRATDNTLRLDSPENRAKASIEDVAWMTGLWKGEGFGGQVEETWSTPVGNSMMGNFRLIRGGKTVFYEMLLLIEEEGSLTLKVKHFTPDFVAWEEKPDSISFKLIRLAPGEAYFGGLTIRRLEERLDIYLRMKGDDGRFREEYLGFRKGE